MTVSKFAFMALADIDDEPTLVATKDATEGFAIPKAPKAPAKSKKAAKRPEPTLDWKDLERLGKSDSKSRWHPHPELYEYFRGIRAPSAAWPHSYAKAALTAKFYKWLKANHPQYIK